MGHISQRIKLRLTDTTPQASDDVSSPQVLETRSDAIDSSMTAFDYLRQGGLCFGARGKTSLLPLAVVAVETHQKQF